MSATPVAVGVDNGGTWIRVCVKSSHHKVLRSIRKPSPPVSELPLFLRRALSSYAGRIHSLTVASKGVWNEDKRRALKHALRGLTPRVLVMSDVEGAWCSAFSTRASGIVLIAGTGSIAYGRARSGAYARAGGLGPATGDEGSGFWIGKRWLIANGKPWKALSVRKIARIAPRVIQRAQRKDPVALQIVAEAHEALAALLVAVARRLHIKNPHPVLLHGSVLANAVFRKGFLLGARRAGLRIHPVKPSSSVAEVLSGV